MKTVTLTVNGESCSAVVSARTQLAELLRDHLHLTGTHLGCEHGVCGACTVLVDGKPMRSCITWAQACEGAGVVTVEGLGDDPTGRALREAFARHHALQCGFCTSGMLITAWDIVTRLAPTDDAAIRRELAGNLCRCTGYMGIVAAVRDVAGRHRSGVATPAGGETVPPAAADDGRRDSATPSAIAFEPFEVDPIHLAGAEAAAAGAATIPAGPITQADGWTLVERQFVIGHPVDALWSLFEDVPRVAQCLPGVHVESIGADRFAGRAEIRFGPIGASFRGEGTRETDPARRTGVIAGRGSDRRGHARLDAELRYAMSAADAPGPAPRTHVGLAIRFRIQGGLAQFNRSDLIESFADVMLAEFVRNCERRLAGEEVRAAAGASGFALMWRMIKARLGF